MTDETPGFRVTLKDVYEELQEVKTTLANRLPDDVDSRLRRVENQIAAQWVVVGIVVVALGALLTRTLTQ